VKITLDYLYNVKKIDEIEIGDIIFTDVDENNRPIDVNIVLKKIPAYEGFYSRPTIDLFCLDDKEVRNIDFDGVKFVYFLGNACQKLSIKELMKNVQKRYVWLGIEYDLIKVLVNLLDGNVEKYNYETEEWDYISDEIEDNGYMMTLTFGDVRFRINLTNLKVQIANPHTLKFRNYNNFLLGLEGEFVFNAENELELIKPSDDK